MQVWPGLRVGMKCTCGDVPPGIHTGEVIAPFRSNPGWWAVSIDGFYGQYLCHQDAMFPLDDDDSRQLASWDDCVWKPPLKVAP